MCACGAPRQLPGGPRLWAPELLGGLLGGAQPGAEHLVILAHVVCIEQGEREGHQEG